MSQYPFTEQGDTDMQTIQIIMDLNGEKYAPELADDRGQFNLIEVARDIHSGEWPGEFVSAAAIDWGKGTMWDFSDDVRAMLAAHDRRTAA